MKAQLKPRINMEGRTKLETVIPLSTPYLVFLDPSSLCNAHCGWCPTGSGENKKYYTPGLMDYELYKKIIDDLAAMPAPIKTLRLYKDGEPMLNAGLADMISYAKKTGCFGQIDFTTNGTLLGKIQFVRDCVDAGLDKIFISVPQGYGTDYIGHVSMLHFYSNGTCKINIKTIADHMDKMEVIRFYREFGDYCDEINVEHLAPCWPNYDVGAVGQVGIYGQSLQDVQVCPYVLYSLSINSDGSVSTCFLDYPHQMILGDLKKESFGDIWRGSKLRDFQIMQLQRKRHLHPFCANCHQLIYGAPDCLDEFSKELLKKISLDYLP